MRTIIPTLILATSLATAATAAAGTADDDAPGVADQIAALEQQCAASADARAGRHAERALFERLGGEEGIHAFTRELVRLHLENEAVRGFFDGLDPDAVADRVAVYMIAGTGGPQAYDGPDLTTSHARMGLTDADFLAAGGDVVRALQNLGYGQDEIDEVICILVSLRPQVVLADAPADAEHPGR